MLSTRHWVQTMIPFAPKTDGRIRYIDLSHPLDDATPPFPGDPATRVTILDSVDRSSENDRHSNCSHISMCLHCGTHMDAPFHFFDEGPSIDQVPLDQCMGPALLLDLSASELKKIEANHLSPWNGQLRAVKRIVINTGWHRRWTSKQYFIDHPVLTAEAARYLVQREVVLVGVDFPSVDRPPFDAHVALLSNGVVIVENLTNLDSIGDERFLLFAVPLRIAGRDGSPVRAIACVDSA